MDRAHFVRAKQRQIVQLCQGIGIRIAAPIGDVVLQKRNLRLCLREESAVKRADRAMLRNLHNG